MKIANKIIALALMAVAMVFTACSKDDDVNNVPSQKEIETKIIGKWKKMKQDGKDVATNQRTIWLFNNDGKGTLSVADHKEGDDRFIWDNKESVQYSVQGNVVYIISPSVERTSTIPSISDSQMTMHVTKVLSHGIGIKADYVGEYSKITADYSKDIIGLWEGVEMTGYETYGNAEARIEYRADGTYTYYQKVDGYWVPSADADNEYNVDGDWLATRWRPEAGADYNYEWWDIDYIKDGMMKWSALREKEDGTRFTTTFTWKKVKLPTQQEIEEKIIGKWKTVGIDGEDCLTNTRMVFTYNADGTLYSSVSEFSEPLSQYIWDIRDQGTYSITGNVMTQSLTNKGITSLSNIYAISDIHFVEHVMHRTLLMQLSY